MAELKTKKTTASVDGFLARVDEARRADCEQLVAMMSKATGAEPKMWGPAIVGFGDLRLVYDSGRELDWFEIGFSPRKSDLTLYLSYDLENELAAELAKLGRHRRGKSCLYVKRLADVDLAVLEKMIAKGVRRMRARGRD